MIVGDSIAKTKLVEQLTFVTRQFDRFSIVVLTRRSPRDKFCWSDKLVISATSEQSPGEQLYELRQRLVLLAKSAHPELSADCRLITPGDELALTEAEFVAVRRSVVSVQRASGAARILARRLLAMRGVATEPSLPKTASGAPQWPPGFVGSLSHDREVAVAVIVPSRSLPTVGVDVEPALPLPDGLLDLVATPNEQRQLNGDLTRARLLFCIKEAVYKAVHPLDGIFLEHHDVEVCLDTLVARTSSGRQFRTYAIERPRLVALAMLA
jgi:4'-phosphopantetheinyl transferase EntD